MDSQTETGAGRWTPLLGALSAVLLLVGMIGLGGSTPDSEDGPAKIAHFYIHHSHQQVAAAYMAGLAGVALLLFMPAMRQRLAATQDGSRSVWISLVTASFAVVGAGMLVAAGTHATLATDAKDLPPVAVAALNSADGAGFIAMFGGISALFVSIVAAGWKPRTLPRWLLVPAGLVAVVAVSPIFWVGGLLGMVWIGVAGVYMTLSGATAPTGAPAPAPATA